MAGELREVPVSLRDRESRGARFLPAYPVAFRDGFPDSIEYGGRLYEFSHTIENPGYGGASQPVYVFTEAEA